MKTTLIKWIPIYFLLLLLKIREALLINWVRLNNVVSIRAYQLANSESVKNYCNYNNKIFSNKGDYKKGFLLMDCFMIPQWIMTSSILLDHLSKISGAGIASFGFSSRDLYVDKLFKSFGANKHLELKLTRTQKRRRNELFRLIILRIKTKNDLHQLTIDGVKIGIDIYESILRTGLPTVSMGNFLTYKYLYYGLRYFIYFQEMMQIGKIKGVVLSHDCYINSGILEKLAYKYSVPVYFANLFEIIRTNSSNQIHKRFLRYPEYYNALPNSEKESGRKKATIALEKRLQGDVGINMPYQTKSAFTSEKKTKQTSDSNKIKIIIVTHCFYDNPHAYGHTLFIDFYEWLIFLGEMTLKTNYEWFIKPHRDYLPGTMEALENIVKHYPALKLIDHETTFHQLRDEGVSVALTCYGSVGHELPGLGYHVINAGYNPHIAYNFNTHCKSLSEYEKCLLNLESVSVVTDLETIPEFYYIHYFKIHRDDYFFDSYKDYMKHINNDIRSLISFDYFMKNANRYVDRYHMHVKEILSSKYHYSCELDILKVSDNKSFQPKLMILMDEDKNHSDNATQVEA